MAGKRLARRRRPNGADGAPSLVFLPPLQVWGLQGWLCNSCDQEDERLAEEEPRRFTGRGCWFGDTYIGELTCMTGAPATATVTLAVKSRYFCISSESLRKLARSNSHLAQAIDHSFAGDTRKKLVMVGVLAQKNPSARPIGQTLGEQPTVN